MLNDNLIFLSPAHFSSRVSLPNSCYFPEEASSFSCHDSFDSSPASKDPYAYYDEDEHYGPYYLKSIRDKEEHRQHCDNAIRHQQAYIAYMADMERKMRRQKLIEKERIRQQYLMEAERQRCEEEEQQRAELERHFMALLEHKRHQQLKKEQMKSQRAKALQEFLRRQQGMMRRRTGNESFERYCSNPMKDQELIQGLDGNLYRKVVNNDSTKNNMINSNPMRSRQRADQKSWHKHQHEKDDPSSLSQRSFINVPGKEDNKESKDDDHKKRADSKRKRTLSKSSILIGEVEDASDSECEEEYHDYWHNRRPQPGEWIEPIDSAKMNV